MYIIKSESGTYWNEANYCFGPLQDAEIYKSIDDLPTYLADAEIRIHSTQEDGGFLDIQYYNDNNDFIASVEEV